MKHEGPTLSNFGAARALRRALKVASLERERSMGGPEAAYWSLQRSVRQVVEQLEEKTWPDVS